MISDLPPCATTRVRIEFIEIPSERIPIVPIKTGSSLLSNFLNTSLRYSTSSDPERKTELFIIEFKYFPCSMLRIRTRTGCSEFQANSFYFIVSINVVIIYIHHFLQQPRQGFFGCEIGIKRNLWFFTITPLIN